MSAQIRALEEELDVVLFERRGSRISLNPMGKRLHRLALPLVKRMDRLPDTFAEEHYGVFANHLCIGAGQTSAAYLLPVYLKRFRERYPNLRIEVRTGTGQQRLDWLRTYELDLVVAAMDVPGEDVEFHPVYDSRMVLIVPQDHALAGRESVAVGELAANRFVGHATATYATQIMETMLRLRGVAPKFVIEVAGWNVVANYVAAGVGISFVPDLCITDHEPLWTIALGDAVPSRTYGAVTRSDGLLTQAASRFLEIMVDAPGDESMGP